MENMFISCQKNIKQKLIEVSVKLIYALIGVNIGKEKGDK